MNFSGRAYERKRHHITSVLSGFVDLREDCSHFPEQDPVNITMADIQERVSVRRQHSRCSGQLQIPWDPTKVIMNRKEVDHSQYLCRLRQVLRSQPYGQNKICAIKTHALLVIRYPAGIITRAKEEIPAKDRYTRKLFTMHGGFHPEAVHKVERGRLD